LRSRATGEPYVKSDTARQVEAADPKPWGITDEELATRPLVFRDDLLAGQTFLVSGGGSGFGRAIAYVCARLGADVMVCGRRQEKLEETAAGIEKHLNRSIGTMALASLRTTSRRRGRANQIGFRCTKPFTS
jgi:shikimate 5-dehydrogenase